MLTLDTVSEYCCTTCISKSLTCMECNVYLQECAQCWCCVESEIQVVTKLMRLHCDAINLAIHYSQR